MTRLNGPVTKLVHFKGPVAIGIFEDGTILVAGPMDDPVLIQRGHLMRVAPNSRESERIGDLEFRYSP